MTWPAVPLGALLQHRKGFVQIDDLTTYKRCRVQLHAKGIVLRDAVPGAAIKTKTQQVCKAGDFLVAEIDAKVGGYGMVPQDLEGAIVSSHYFLFDIVSNNLNRGFLGWFIRTPFFHDQVRAQGSTNYAAIRPGDVLEYRIPLPPIEEQRRIVAKIEELAAKIEEARQLRSQADAELELLSRSAVSALCESSALHTTIPLRNIIDKRVVGNDSPENGPFRQRTSCRGGYAPLSDAASKRRTDVLPIRSRRAISDLLTPSA